MPAQPGLAAVRRSFAFKCTLLVIGWVLAAIACTQIPARAFWPASFITLTLPVALGLNGAAAGYWLLRNWRVAVLPLLVLVLTWPHFQRGLALHPLHWAPAAGAAPGQRVRVLSANVRIFNVYPQLHEKDPESPDKLIRWVASQQADIICLQEFYNEPRKAGKRNVLSSVDRIGRQTGRQAFVSKSLTNWIGAEFGMAIFSRYPIVGRGTITFDKLTQNHAMYADLKLPGGDTIRVYNFHLQSMSMEEQDIVDSYSSKDGLKAKGLGLMRRFKRGLVARSVQMDTLTRRFEQCRYPLLLCADLNDLPYSYSYDQLADRFQNAWAAVGTGIGSTYNGRLPFVRIDNQFVGPQWIVDDFRVHYDVPYSDHFPTTAVYRLK
ncbi:Metal-dependent hydrolase, endonuclease/exonuclease/phosphatase family [Hymenobacter daecheongensis DSM 21074]|uniref:Metal-dependent hydrolase, endonuclease/exonuclease/phosphatase family n=1 Tax=Hymenobacter daecheongensis DSM 21074 TaxID=1121955 RepID=A0A1M6LGN7_9BACT|nr:endonuclease/exonuclease/phosphatase family protein [Hymenobacter daecheongensis]SHJ70362.1 Metal-dependent hydrolase, endonuclease/exonuclease/phosphatase family [Hymenobacter daecheongensis DSM 21074]